MKYQLIPGIFFLLFVLTACNTKQEEEENGIHYTIGSKEWYVEFPENYVSFANMPMTDEFNNACGVRMDVQTTQLLKLQQNDTLWVSPIPNMVSVFLVPKKLMDKSDLECSKKLIDTYAFFVENSNSQLNYNHVEKEVSIDDIQFLEIENTFSDSTGNFSHGSLEYMGTVGTNWMHIQLSYNDMKERDLLLGIIMKSKFE